MQWRLTLDVPYDFAIEPEYVYPRHCRDFRPGKASEGIYRDEITGVVMLEPSLFTNKYKDGFEPVANWRLAANNWQQAKRGADHALLMAAVLPAGQTKLLDIVVTASLVIVEQSLADFDDLAWMGESNFYVEQDECFAIHYHALSDELLRKRNLFALQWDNLYLHFGGNGLGRVYQYADRNNLAATPTLLSKFQFAFSSEILNRPGYFAFFPIPGIGLLMLHRYEAPGTLFSPGNVNAVAARGVVLPIQSWVDNDGVGHLTERSQVRFALNPYNQAVLAFQHITFPASGTFVDDTSEPVCRVSTTPTPLGIPLNTRQQVITPTYRKPDDSGDWTSSDRQGVFKATLQTSDTKYTPFLYGYTVTWPKVMNTRATTPLVLANKRGTGKQDSLQSLEWSEDEYSRFEGKCELLIETAAGRLIADRGDATFLLEYSADGVTWTALFGGFAKEWRNKPVITENGFHYLSTCSLKDIWERFREWALVFISKFDALDVGTALNLVLRAVGFPPISPMPPQLTAKRLPPIRAANAWRFQAREGDSGDEIVRTLLLFMRAQFVEWRIRWDSVGVAWIAEKRARDLVNYWQGVPASKDRRAVGLPAVSEANRVFRYGEDTEILPHPPEFNMLQVEGLFSPDPGPESKRFLTDGLPNKPSLTDPASPDYLGRMINQVYACWPISDEAELLLMCRRIFDRAAHRTFDGKIPVPDLMMSLAPNVLVYLLDNLGVIWPTNSTGLWIKRRTVTLDMEGKEQMLLEVDSVWESDLK